MADDLKTTQNGNPIFWNGHLCEGNRMVPFDAATFLLWTRCGKRDVPANAATELHPDDKVTCAECLAIVKPATTTPASPTPDATTPGRVELPGEMYLDENNEIHAADHEHLADVRFYPHCREMFAAALTPSPSAGMEEIGQLLQEHERAIRENESGFLDDATLAARRRELTATLASLRAEREVPR